MAEQKLKVFVSYSHEDSKFCGELVRALWQAGADAWFDDYSLDSGLLLDTIERELRERPVFVLILSPAALRSQWVRDECKWAYSQQQRDPSRIILPVLAAPLPDDNAIWMFLQDFKRIEAPGGQPFPLEEAVLRTLEALSLAGPKDSRPVESVEDLLARAEALKVGGKHAEALPLFERAAQLAPGSFEAWFNLGYIQGMLKNYLAAEAAFDIAARLNPNSAVAWSNKAIAFEESGRYEEALAAYDHALTLDATFVPAWNNKGSTLKDLGRYDEALTAYDQALALDPSSFFAWNNKGYVLHALNRYSEALVALERALALEPNFAMAWNNEGMVFISLGRFAEALVATDRALALAPDFAMAWFNRGVALESQGDYAGALAAYERGFDPNDPRDWIAKSRCLSKLGRIEEAFGALRQAAAVAGY